MQFRQCSDRKFRLTRTGIENTFIDKPQILCLRSVSCKRPLQSAALSQQFIPDVARRHESISKLGRSFKITVPPTSLKLGRLLPAKFFRKQDLLTGMGGETFFKVGGAQVLVEKL